MRKVWSGYPPKDPSLKIINGLRLVEPRVSPAEHVLFLVSTRLQEADMADIVLITGAPGAGKSTVGRALAERFDPSFHLKVDDLRENMVNGFILPEVPFTQELIEQFATVRRTATFMAQDFATAGVTFVVDDTPIPESFPEQYAGLYADNRVTRVLLRADDDAVVDRLRKRGGPFDDHLISLGPAVFNQELSKLPTDGWHIIDSTNLSVDETVDEITRLLA